jgi:hypothetical protein
MITTIVPVPDIRSLPSHSTLLNLVQVLQRRLGLGEDEVVALALRLINSGRVQLTGNFAGELMSVH